MQPSLDELRITQRDLDRLTGLDISDAFMGRAVRPSALRSPRRLLAVLGAELLMLGLIIIFCLPLSLVIAQRIPGFSGSAASTVQFLQVSLGISLGLFAGWNGYLWVRTRALRPLGHLLDAVDKHNDIIDALQVLDELTAVQPASSTGSVGDRQDVIQALSATRESLACGLMTERILRKHQRMITRQQALLSSIETNLSLLQTLQIEQTASDYGDLINAALQVGLSVRQEMQKLEPEGGERG